MSSVENINDNREKFMRSLAIICSWLMLAGLSGKAQAADENKNYRYDALGRLVEVEVLGGPADGQTRNYQLDDAGNRTRVIAANAHSSADAHGARSSALHANAISVAFIEGVSGQKDAHASL